MKTCALINRRIRSAGEDTNISSL